MSPIHAILIVIIRVWAAGVIIGMLGSFPMLMAVPQIEGAGKLDPTTTAYLINHAVWIIFGIVGWSLAPMLAKLAYPKGRDDSVSIAVGAEELVMLGSFLIGGFYLVQYLPSLITDLGAMLIAAIGPDQSDPNGLGRMDDRLDIERLVRNGIVTLVALWMALRPVHVGRIFSNLRQAGLYKTDAKN